MDTLQVKLLVLAALTEGTFYKDSKDFHDTAEQTYQWIMMEAKKREDGDPPQLTLFNNEDLMN